MVSKEEQSQVETCLEQESDLTQDADTAEAQKEAVEAATLAVCASDAEGWFAHCGYYPQCE